jgi:hypothetical protein
MEARLTVSFSASVFRAEVKFGDDACRERGRTLLLCARSSPALETSKATPRMKLSGAGNSQGYERLKPPRDSSEIRAIIVFALSGRHPVKRRYEKPKAGTLRGIFMLQLKQHDAIRADWDN